MGHRANLLLVRNRSYDLYYSHWCAYTLPTELFWGPQHAVPFIEGQKRVDASGWLDDLWAEGGAVVDFDQSKLLLYGGEELRDHVPLRRLFLKLMRQAWQGWEIEWAHHGIADLAACVGYPVEKVITAREARTSDADLAPLEDKSWLEGVASVSLSPEELLLFPLSDGIEVYLSAGPDLIHKINPLFGYKQLAVKDWSERFPTGGFHLDLTQKRLELWHADTIPINLYEQLRTTWAGWAVVDNQDQYETQLTRTRGRLQFHDPGEPQLLEELKLILLREPPNPPQTLADIATKEAAAGKPIKINPRALQYHPYPLPKQLREEIINLAVARLKG